VSQIRSSGANREPEPVTSLGFLASHVILKETEGVHEILNAGTLGYVVDIEVEVTLRERVVVIPTQMGDLLRVTSLKSDVECRQALLAIEDHCDRMRRGDVSQRIVDRVASVEVPNELVVLELWNRFGFHFPEEERPDRVLPHQTVEQSLDLVIVPDELSLNRGQVILPTSYSFENVHDRQRLKGHQTPPRLKHSHQP
jgi:hypothetical protein